MLRRTYPAAVLEAIGPEAARPAGEPPWWSLRRWSRPALPARAENELEEGAAELVWANMMLHALADPLAVMRRWQRSLAVDGFLMFSTLGPGTLPQLRSLYEEEGWGPPMAPLVDMHDLGDMLVEAGVADPVVDQELVTLSFRDAESALAELRGLGGNADPQRCPGLRTPRWRTRLAEGLARQARSAGGRVELSFEVVYGHAFKPAPRPRVASEASFAVEDLRATTRAHRRSEGIHEGRPPSEPPRGVH